MAVSKEVDSVSYTLPSETLSREHNSFLLFIDKNKDMFEKHSSLTYDLRDEEQGWRDSPTVKYMAETYLDLRLLLSPGLNNIPSKTMRQLGEKATTITRDLVFGKSNAKEGLIAKMFPHALSAKFRFTPQSEASIKTLEENFDDFSASYREAISPLVIGVRESKAELLKKFEDFLLSNPSNLFAFQAFLWDKKHYGADREAIRPFLSSLVQTERTSAKDKKEGILQRTVRKWVNELKETPTHGIIDEFTPSIKSSAILEWLEFAAQGENIASLLKSRPDVSTWPSELKNALFSFVSSKYYSALSFVERDLDQFRRPVSSKSISLQIDPEPEEKIEKVPAKTAIQKKPDKKKKTLEKTERGKYPVGILTKNIGAPFEVSVLTEEELAGHLQKEADSLATSDVRMMGDLKNIVANLQKDPYGLGTKKLTERFVRVGNRTLNLRSINPGKRIGLPVDHPISPEIRIVYVIYENEHGPVIGIEGIYKHEDYDKKFLS